MRQRRIALDLSQRDAAARARISNQTWLNVENGRGASDRSMARIERALDWPSGTAAAILAGSNQVPEPPIDRDRLLAQLAGEDLTRDEIEQVVSYARELRRGRLSAGNADA